MVLQKHVGNTCRLLMGFTAYVLLAEANKIAGIIFTRSLSQHAAKSHNTQLAPCTQDRRQHWVP